MPVNVATKPAVKSQNTPPAAPALPERPATVNLVLRGCERFDHERQLYVRNVVYTFTYENAVRMLRLKDEQERPRFVRYVPGQQHRKVMVEVPKQVDLTAKKVAPPRVSDAPPETPAKIIEVGDEAELEDIEGLHLSADVAGIGDETGEEPPPAGVEV